MIIGEIDVGDGFIRPHDVIDHGPLFLLLLKSLKINFMLLENKVQYCNMDQNIFIS